MPRGDKTGPLGQGSMTGRRLGYCSDNDWSGFEMNFGNYGRGFGRMNRRAFGRGAGYGYRHGFSQLNDWPNIDIKEETLIENEVHILKDRLSALEKRKSDLLNNQKDKK